MRLICRTSVTDALAAPPLSEASLRDLVADGLKTSGRPRGIEWPTVALAVAIYGGWLLTTAFHAALPLVVFLPLCTVLTLWQSSLQHEVLHGHPTRSRRINRLFGMPPLVLWLPYERYRQTHLTHHIDERLTDPIDDPESRYLTWDAWDRLNPVARVLVRAQTTLLGRVLIGPYWAAAHFLLDEARRILAGEGDARRVWFEHLLWLVPVALWITLFCRIPLWLYFVGVAMPATGLMMIRSFAEHRAEFERDERTAIVENSWILGPLFLFNNLHVVHHHAPLLPWYRIPGWYRAHREVVLRSNGGLVYDSYFDVARRFLLKPHDAPRHPYDRAPRG
jgi:fatty acid desaturase